MAREFQKIGQTRLDRTCHVWKQHNPKRGTWKCVLCGGVSDNPGDVDLPGEYEELTQEERDLCPRALRPAWK